MSERTISPEEKEDLIQTFENVLNDFEVVAKSDVEALVEERVAALHKADEDEDLQPVDPHEALEREAEAAAQAAEETFSMTVEELREALPADVWEVVSRHLSAAESPVPDTDMVGMESDVEKAILDARRSAGPTLTKVRSELAAHQEASPSYETEEVKKGRSPTDAILERFYSEPSTAPVTKSKESKSTPAGLMAIEEADL